MLKSLRVLLGLLEVNVRLESVSLTSVVNSVMRMDSIMRVQVETHIRVVSCSCFSHFSIGFSFFFNNLKLGAMDLLNIN